MHDTTGGKLLLAYGPESRVEELLQEGLAENTEYTIVMPEELLAELESIRQQGYAVANQESEIGLRAIGAPIRDRSGVVVAGVSVSGPPERIAHDSFPQLLDGVLEAARQISAAIGWFGD